MNVSKKKPKLQKRYIMDNLGSKTAVQILRCLYSNLHLGLGIAEIADILGTSRANVYRRLPDLEKMGIVRRIKKGRKTLYKVDVSSPLSLPFFEIFNHEKYLNVRAEIRNVLALYITRIRDPEVRSVVLFGSQARGLATSKSDIDLCIVHSGEQWDDSVKKAAKELFAEAKIEIHEYSLKDFEEISDFAVLDSLLVGIPLTGHEYFFKQKESVRSMDSNYLVYRLEKCRENLQRARKVGGEGKKYFEGLVEVSLNEIESILSMGVTLPKKEIYSKRRYEYRIRKLHERIAEAGDKIWLE